MARAQFIFLCLVVCAYNTLFAQTTYMGVTLDRGKDPETNCIYIFNDNGSSVKVIIQYKIGNRNREWIDYPFPEVIPPSLIEPQKIGCVDSTIIGLKLVDVIVVKENSTYIDKQNLIGKHKQEGFFQRVKSWFSKE